MRNLLILFLAFFSICLFGTLGLADICAEVEMETGLDLNDAECYVLEQVEKGEVAHFEDKQSWPHGAYLNQFSKIEYRTLSADFLKRLLTGSLPGIEFTKEGVGIRNARVNEFLEFRNATIPFPIKLNGCIFEETVVFMGTQFSGNADFAGVQFSGNADFAGVQFSGNANFVKSQFSGTADFKEAQFRGVANFSGARFSGVAYFVWVQFYMEVFFGSVQFSGDADFFETQFSEKANFYMTQFSGVAEFRLAKFSREANFERSQFSGVADFVWVQYSDVVFFRGSKFRDSSYFGACLYLGKTALNKVTGFSNMQIEWQYDPEKFGKEEDEKKAKSRGLKGHLEYDETFYIALIKNYRDMGWFTEADDCYYTYRVKKRNHLLKKLNEQSQKGKNNTTTSRGLWERIKLYGEWLLLDLTFGYGVKPKKIFWTFVVFWIFFIPIYSALLRHQWIRNQSWFKDLHKRFFRAAVFSLDTLTPGVNFRLESTLPPYTFTHSDFRKQIFNFCIRCQQILGWYWAALFLILFSKIWIR